MSMTTSSARPLAWLVEFSEVEADGSEVKVAIVDFVEPTGHYKDCATSIFDQAQLDRLLEAEKAERIRSLQGEAHDEEILSAERYVTPMSSAYF